MSRSIPMRVCRLIEFTPTEGYSYSAALGYLAAACAADPSVGRTWDVSQEVHQIQPFDGGDAVARAVESMTAQGKPDVVGFSVSFWNRRHSFECARDIKTRWPTVKVVVGGCDVSFQGSHILGEESPIDVVINGEGEVTFPELLRAFDGELSLDEVLGISYWTDGAVRNTDRRPLIADLNVIASPFLTGGITLEQLGSTRLLVYESNRGCPYACAYCYWGGATRTAIRCFSMARVAREIEFIVAHCSDNMVFFLADANFGILERDLAIARLIVVACARHRRRIIFNTNWTKRPRDTALKAAKILHEAGLMGGMTVSVQSFDKSVMRKARRTNISPAMYCELLESLQSQNIGTYTDLIWGLPGQSCKTLLNDVDICLDAGGCPVVYPLMLLPNTEFFTPNMRREYGLATESIPSDLTTPALSGEMVVANSSLSREEWRYGMRFSLGLNLFWKCLFRATITALAKRFGYRYSHILEVLVEEFFEDGMGDSVIRAILSDFEATISGLQPPPTQRAYGMVGNSGLPEQSHFQALLKRFVYGQGGELPIAALTEILRRMQPDANLNPYLELDKLARITIQSTLASIEPSRVKIDRECAFFLSKANVLKNICGDGQKGVDLRAVNVSSRFRFSAYALAIWHGGESPLRSAEVVGS